MIDNTNEDGLREVILMKSCEFGDPTKADSIVDGHMPTGCAEDAAATRLLISYDDGTCNVIEYHLDTEKAAISHVHAVLPSGERVHCNEVDQLMRSLIHKRKKELLKDHADTSAIILDYVRGLTNVVSCRLAVGINQS